MSSLSADAAIRATRPATSDWADRYPDSIPAPRIEDWAARSPDVVAIVDGSDGTRLTYRELAVAVDRLAGALQARGVGPGDVVMAQLPNWWEAAVVFHAVARLGAVLNPVVPIYRDREVGFIVRQARPKVVFTPHQFRGFDHLGLARRVSDPDDPPLLVAVRPRAGTGTLVFDDLLAEGRSAVPAGEPSDIALLLYTSGTTADPKGVLHSHQTLGYEVRSIVDLFSLGADDAVFMPSPVTHITGLLFGLLMPVVTGCTAVLLDIWDAREAVDLVERESCRFIMGATPFLHGMTEEHARRGHESALRVFLCGGADVPPALIRRAAEVLGCHVARVYGSSELPTVSCGGPGDDLRLRAETDGMPIGPVVCRLDDVVDGVGELVVDGPERFLGYFDPALNEAAFTADGLLRTGDLASIDERGAVTIRGRRKDIIVRGGENISAKEIEDLLHQHPAVAEAAVVAMPDPVLAERACAFVVPAAGPHPTLADLTRFLEGHRLARQKLPERLEVVDALPMTASGKVQKFVLRERARALLAAEAQPSRSLSGLPTPEPPSLNMEQP